MVSTKKRSTVAFWSLLAVAPSSQDTLTPMTDFPNPRTNGIFATPTSPALIDAIVPFFAPPKRIVPPVNAIFQFTLVAFASPVFLMVALTPMGPLIVVIVSTGAATIVPPSWKLKSLGMFSNPVVEVFTQSAYPKVVDLNIP